MAAASSMRAAEPVYQGKAFSEWLVAMQADLTDEETRGVDPLRLADLRDRKHDQAKEAIRQMGTNGLPTLLDLVGVVEKNRRSVARQVKSRDIQESLRDSNPDFREAVRGMAVDGFAVLGTNAEPALPALNKLLHGDPNCQLDVTRAMLRVGPKGFAALTNIMSDPADPTRNTLIWVIGEEGGKDRAVTELLIQALKDANWSNRGNAARFLKGRDPELAIPVLIPMLDDYKNDYYTIKGVAQALSSYGSAASNAVPKLYSLYTNALANTNSLSAINWGKELMGALKAIDTNAAGRAEQFLVNSGPLNYARRGHTATLLANGMELIAGGVIDTEVYVETNRFLASAQLLDPKTGKWKETGKMTTPREGHAAILLRDDRVLVVGGFGASVDGKFPPILNSAELYDPATGAWMDAGTMKFAREGPSVTMKHDGKVLISGGWNHGSVSNDELFDPATGLWTVVTNK